MTEAAGDPRDKQTYESGLALLRDGRVDEGIEVLLRLAPRAPKVLGDVAWAYRSRGDNRAAFLHLNQYLQHFPDDSNAWAVLTQVAREVNDLPAAEAAARRAVALQPGEARLWHELGEVLFYRNKWRAAARAYSRCLKLDPQFSKAQVRRQLARRLIGLGPIHTLVRWKPIRALLRWFVSSRLVSDLLELDLGIALHDCRWQLPLQWEGAVELAAVAPPDQTPERFAVHFRECRCPFWEWFGAMRLEGRVRKVLELGAGPGHVAHHFACAGFEVQSLVLDEAALRDRARRAIPAVAGDPHLVGERGGSFDLLLADHALQHSRAPLFALWEWNRLLRPDGYLLLLAHLPVDRPTPLVASERATGDPRLLPHLTYGVAGHVLTLTYWQLRRLFKIVGFQLLAETLAHPATGTLESTEYVDGRRPPDPAAPWDLLVVLRKPGTLPYDGALEKPRPPLASPRAS